jgi:hypothetical protein
LQQICVGGDRDQMQQPMVDGNRWYDNATHKVRCNNAIATKINGCLLFYRNEVNLNSSLQINCTTCTSHLITETFFI